ncbi:uncharacterized protein DNG_10430 [Cephalotrichum gorgonifer]|uniref:Heterokaryon incompatibility domain-containing protein n=1 Tax=Cephalotrichum gorgonifer TaxID=2041049 RepID=A0AAE8N9H6_9PEZI|nr:uncharacterized protein DNG_10430 [Cephalotrichum gorgonifer]
MTLFYCTVLDAVPPHETQDPLVPFHTPPESLPASSGVCDLCYAIQKSYSKVIRSLQHANELDFSWPVSNYQLWLANTGDNDGFLVLGRSTDESPESNTSYTLMGAFGLCVENESLLGSIFEGRKIPESPVSSSALEDIKRWVRRCAEQHGHPEPRPSRLPTRVVDIKDGGTEVALLLSKNMTGEYAALSHCWGPIQPMTLTRKTLEKLCGGIRTVDLPQTFQDAIWITHQLGLRYLWIDTLCILQDDHSDWVGESARMCNVYENSTLTIAATRSTGSSEGFLGNRVGRTYVPLPFRHNGTTSEALAFDIPLNNRYLAGLWLEDLIQRLCWSIGRHAEPGFRPQVYRAPTWSWASIEGDVDYPSGMSDSTTDLALIQDVHIDLESPNNVFGRVKSGYLHLRATRLRPFTEPSQSALFFCEYGVSFYVHPIWDAESYLAPAEGKLPDPTRNETELFAVPLNWKPRDIDFSSGLEGMLFFLILKRAKHDVRAHAAVPGFQRVGSGIGQDGTENGASEIMALVESKWAVARELGELEDMLIL